MIGIESVEPEPKEALFPANDGRSTGLQPTLDGAEGRLFGQHQDEPGAKDVSGRERTRLRNAVKFCALAGGKRDFVAGRHTC